MFNPGIFPTRGKKQELIIIQTTADHVDDLAPYVIGGSKGRQLQWQQ